MRALIRHFQPSKCKIPTCKAEKLGEKGLVNYLRNGVDAITEDGELYLEGRLDTEDWQYIEEEVSENINDDSTEDAVTDS